MNLYILIIGLCICLLTTSLFLHSKVTKGGINSFLLKTFASLSFIVVCLLLSSGKIGVDNFANYTISCLIISLVCNLISDMFIELKTIYPFHEKKYNLTSSILLIVSHVFNACGIILIANNIIDVFSKQYLIPLAIISASSIILAVAIYLIFTKCVKIDLRIFKLQTFINYFIIILTTTFAIYLAVIVAVLPIYILVLAYVLNLVSNILQTIINFAENEKINKFFTPCYSIYYLSLAFVCVFIFLI